MFSSILDAIGNTPLLKLSKTGGGTHATILLKLENRNPGGSVKDRVAVHLLREALKDGKIAPGDAVIEGTSGNMGIGLALAAKSLGLRCLLAMPESMSLERRKLLKALGAELVLTPARDGMKAAVATAEKMAAEGKGLLIGQFVNPKAPDAHYQTTGPEIWTETQGRVDLFVSGVGSGSTLMGVGRYLREHNKSVRLVAVEPEESPVLSGGAPAPHGIQGIGAGFVPGIYDAAIVDEIFRVTAPKAMETSRRLFLEEGVSCGISTGANVAAALEIAKRPENAGKTIVTLACDTGERYLSTALFNQE